MRTTSRHIRQSRLAKQSRRWDAPKENAQPGGGPGQALRGGSPNAKLVPSKRPPARGRLVKLNQPNDPVSLAPAPTFYPSSRVLSRQHLTPVSVGPSNAILETDTMTNKNIVSVAPVADLPTDALGVPLPFIGFRWSRNTPPLPGDLVWVDNTRLARLVVVAGVPHQLLADGTQAPAAGRVARKVVALLMEEDQGFPGNLLVPAPWNQGGARHGS